MKLRSINRRNFFQFLLSAFVVSSCKKIDPSEELSSSTGPVIPPNPPPGVDLGSYTTTELGVGSSVLPDYFKLLNYGYCDKTTYQPGDSVSLYLTGPQNNSKEIFLTDVNDKQIFSFSVPIVPQQIKSTKPWVDGYLFDKTITVKLPSNLKSGIYYWKLGTNVNEIIPLVCNDNSQSDITVVYPSNTYNAYNIGGGKSLYYGPEVTNRSTVASFSRFSLWPADYTSSFFKWLLSQNYNVKYIADSDLDNYANIQSSKIVIIAGHSEYWTRQARENIDSFVNSGKNLLVLSGNTMWWQVRYNQNKNLMICYKKNELDPLGSTPYSTINWTQPSLKYPPTSSIGVDWIGGGYANQLPNRWNGFKIVQENSPLFAGTGLQNGDILKLPSDEVDGAPVVKMILPGSGETPVIDNTKLNFYRVELLAYDFAIGGPNTNGLATFIVFKKQQNSGTVVNVATMNWCSPTGIGGDDSLKIQSITKNMIDLSLANASLFSS